jgi:hypothetical protein
MFISNLRIESLKPKNAVRKNGIQKLSMKFLLATLGCILVSAGLFAFWNWNFYACRSMQSDVTRPDAESKSALRSGNLSLEAALTLENRSKNSERTLADNWNFSEESRDCVKEVSPKYALSPQDQKRSDDLNWRTAVEPAKKSGYLPHD